MGIKDRVSGRLKKAAGDLSGDAGLRRKGAREEAKADARDDLDRAHEQVEEQSARVRDSEIAVEKQEPGAARPPG